MRGQYILEGKQPVACDDLVVWGLWHKKADRHVAREERDGILVSTVFLGLDHGYSGGPPMLFETMVFDSDCEEKRCERCSTWEEAEAQHALVCGETFK